MDEIERACFRGENVSAIEFPQNERDRKSTRLNSSHSQISYAVFCLKKKKKRTEASLGANEIDHGPHQHDEADEENQLKHCLQPNSRIAHPAVVRVDAGRARPCVQSL